MKTPLLAGLLLVAQFGAAQRILEHTTNSWDYPNHSVERNSNVIISGFTDFNPSTGRQAPTFMLTTPSGSPAGSFRLNMPTHANVMDFAIKGANRIILTGSFMDPAGRPIEMYIAEIDFGGNFIQAARFTAPSGGAYLVPAQIIYSPSQSQYVVAGTMVNGLMDPTNAYTIAKRGFVMAVAEPTLNVNFSVFSDSPSGGNDSDMLETLCETPAGYFLAGSANNSAGEQNLLTMGVNFTGGVTFSNIRDNTNFRYAGASVVYRQSGTVNGVYLLANNSVSHTFEVASFNPVGGQTSSFYRYVIGSLPIGSGVDANGFKLHFTNANQLVISGLLTSNAPSILPYKLTPFQMMVSANLASFLSAKMLQTENNSPLTGFYDESGNSVYINTPDIAALDPATNRTSIINPNTGNGYDLNLAEVLRVNVCEKALQATPQVTTPINLGQVNTGSAPVGKFSFAFSKVDRAPSPEIRCAISAAITSDNAMTIAPNPAANFVEIGMENLQSVQILDMSGKVLVTGTATERDRGNITLAIESLATGTYVIRATDADGNVRTEKMVKN